MTGPLRWAEQHFLLLFILGFLWVVTLGAVLAWRRYRSGSVHPPFTTEDILFMERHVSGFSKKHLLSRLGGARNALNVIVLKDALLVEPMAPFKWFTTPSDFNDLEHYVAKADIVQIRPTSRWGKKTVQIEFRGRDGLTGTLELAIRDQENFLNALEPRS